MKMFPLQHDFSKPGPLEIPWSVAEKMYVNYVEYFRTSASLEKIAESGGVKWGTMDVLYRPWREEIKNDEVCILREALRKALVRIGKIEEVAPYTIEEWIKENE